MYIHIHIATQCVIGGCRVWGGSGKWKAKKAFSQSSNRSTNAPTNRLLDQTDNQTIQQTVDQIKKPSPNNNPPIIPRVPTITFLRLFPQVSAIAYL